MTLGHLSGEQDWPVLTLEFNNALHHYQDMDPDDGFEHDPKDYRRYHPESAPNVLSPEEARLVEEWAEAFGPVNLTAVSLRNRLSTYAKEQQ